MPFRRMWIAAALLSPGILLVNAGAADPPARALPQERQHSTARQQALELARAMEHVIETKDFQNQLTLKEAIGLLCEKLAAQGSELPLLVDADAFWQSNMKTDSVYDTPVQFPPFPRRMKVESALRLILGKVKTHNATYLIREGMIQVTTDTRASTDWLLSQRVTARFERTPLQNALDELSHLTGASILLDQRIGDKAATPVSAYFKNTITLENAVRLLVEMADLQVAMRDDILFVTAKAKEENGKKKADLRFRNRSLDLAMRELADWAGVTIVLDPRFQRPDLRGKRIEAAEERAAEPPLGYHVTATFKPDASPAAAVRILADQVGLAVAVLDDAYYLTTRDRAAQLQSEHAGQFKLPVAPPKTPAIP